MLINIISGEDLHQRIPPYGVAGKILAEGHRHSPRWILSDVCAKSKGRVSPYLNTGSVRIKSMGIV